MGTKSGNADMKTALIAGATGLVGSQLLSLLLESPRYGEVKALTRKPLTIRHPRLTGLVVDFSTLDRHAGQFDADDVFCCLGTTIKKARTRENFRKVDYQYPLDLARLAVRNGAHQYLLVSALGASSTSAVFYNKVKGELEDALKDLPFRALHIFRPSLLLGPRDENRPAEEAAKTFYKLFDFLIPGRYKAIEGSKVARAMLHFAGSGQQGVFVHESRDMQIF